MQIIKTHQLVKRWDNEKGGEKERRARELAIWHVMVWLEMIAPASFMAHDCPSIGPYLTYSN